jgi:hypothetical protein
MLMWIASALPTIQELERGVWEDSTQGWRYED